MSKLHEPSRAAKFFVVTNSKGQVIASSAIQAGSPSKDAPSPGGPIAMRGQRVLEIEVPDDFRRLESAVDIHKYLTKLVAQRSRTTKRAKRPTAKKPKSR